MSQNENTSNVPCLSIHTQNSKEPIALKIIKPVGLDLSTVSSHLIHNYNSYSHAINQVNPNKSRVFKCTDQEILAIAKKCPNYVKLSFQLKDQYGILSHLIDDTFIINYISSIPDLENNRFFCSIPFKETLISTMEHSTLSLAPKNTFELSMKPPIQSSPKKSIDDTDDGITDPFDYFVEKYFNTLYQLTTPLTFFTKSTFARLRTLCGNMAPPVEYESILRQFLISFDQFDSRHLISNNGILNSDTLFEVEGPFRNDFISKSLNLVDFDVHSVDYSDTNKSLINILNNFKVREIQLQIIILLELIHTSNRDDMVNDKESKKKKKSMTKRRLIGKRKLTPVINGGAVVSTEAERTQSSALNYNELLESYMDKLCIWEMLNVMGTSKSDHSSAKFVSCVIIPFFEKKCPNSVKSIIKKVKGPSFKAKTSTSSSKSKTEKKTVGLKRSSSVSELKQEVKRPSLSRSASILEGIDELKSQKSSTDLQSLKRTSSFNVSNLSKRQIDISKPASQDPKPAKKTNSTIFNRVGKKILTTSTKLQTDIVVSQVEETPVKKQKIIDVMETPEDSQSTFNMRSQRLLEIQSSVRSGTSHVASSSPVGVMSTPAGALQSPLAIRSTAKKPGEPFEFKSPEDLHLRGSPVDKVRRKLFAPK